MRPLLWLTVAFCVTLARADQATPIEPEARAVVDKWLEAQNHDDFSSYGKLYARTFAGVRRSGPRTVKLDRVAWMRERERMFKKGQTVEISDLHVAAVGAGAVVRFRQRFAAGTFEDVGQKQLDLAREDGTLRVIREEMIDSRQEPGPSLAPVPQQQLGWIVDGDLVVDADPDEHWARGAPWLVSAGNPVVVRHKAEAPSVAHTFKGKRVKLYTLSGPVCEATVSDKVELVAREADAWTDAAPPRDPRERAQLAESVWELGDKVLVAKLVDHKGDCRQARFARAAELPAPEIHAAEAPTPALRDAVLATYRALPAWKELQKTWRADAASKEAGAPKDWDGGPDARTVRVLRTGDQTLVAVMSWTGFSCGEFGGGLWAIYEASGDTARPTLTLRNDASGAGELLLIAPDAAVDLDGDGKPELLFSTGILSHADYDLGVLVRTGSRYRVGGGLTVPYHHCHC